MSTCGCQFDQFLAAFKEALCMPEFPCPSGTVSFDAGAVTASTTGTTITGHASANTKGAITELISSTPYDAHWLMVSAANGAWEADNILMDIMIGGAGSEVVLIGDLQFGSYEASDLLFTEQYVFPVFVPAGSRISARLQNLFGGGYTMDVHLNLIGGGLTSPPPTGRVVSYGATANSRGTTVDPGATINTKGAWAEITPATTCQHNALVMALTTADFNLGTNQRWLIDLGIGAAASEQVLLSNMLVGADDHPLPSVWRLPISVPTGTRLSIRAQCNTNNAGNRVLQVKLYGS